jgi:ribose-phosphate pyrophosphokinase
MLVKQRSAASKIERMDLVGEIAGHDVILVDDMVDTAGTLCEAVAQCKLHGAKRVYAFCTHGLLSGPAAARLAKAGEDGSLEYLVVTNSVPQPPLETWLTGCGDLPAPQVKVLSVAPILAEGIRRLAADQDFEHLRLSKL